MKALIVFVFCVLAYSTMNMYQAKTHAGVYKAGIESMIGNEVSRGPAIVSNK